MRLLEYFSAEAVHQGAESAGGNQFVRLLLSLFDGRDAKLMRYFGQCLVIQIGSRVDAY